MAAPTITSATIDDSGTTIAANLSDLGCTNAAGGPAGTGGFTTSSIGNSIFSWSITGVVLSLEFSRAAYMGEVITLSYSRAATTDDIENGGGEFMVDFSNMAVTNNSNQPNRNTEVSQFWSPWHQVGRPPAVPPYDNIRQRSRR